MPALDTLTSDDPVMVLWTELLNKHGIRYVIYV